VTFSIIYPEPTFPILETASHWLKNCLSNHEECTRLSKPINPTRVLEITPSRTRSKVPRIQLIEPKDSFKPYAALSHCRGKFQPLRTTSANYAAHRRNIPFMDLPKSFQDAVIATVHLGMNRLWIDSLCIIQNSQDDWERECSKMADVYANALVGIAASDARDSSEGFLRKHSSELHCSLGSGVSIRCLPTMSNWTSQLRNEDS